MFLLRPIILSEKAINDNAQLEFLRLETFKHPNNVSCWYKLGVLYYEKGEMELAIGAWQEVTKRRPEFADAYHELGVAFGMLGLFEEAKNHFSQAVKNDPNHIQAQYNLGVVMDVLGYRTEAWKQTKILRRFDPILSEMLSRQLKRRYKQHTMA